MNKVLLIWEEIPDDCKFYILSEGSEAEMLAQKSAGLYINGDELEEGHAIFLLNDMLEGVEPVQHRDTRESKGIINGPFVRVIYCGFFM